MEKIQQGNIGNIHNLNENEMPWMSIASIS